ncbi:MAG: hypothetical protein CMH54_03595 [Myxococcales bacterium]|nr:hypothetical protein [Myxococcales bacterium]
MFSFSTTFRVVFAVLFLFGCVGTQKLEQGLAPCEVSADCPTPTEVCSFAFCVNGGCVYQILDELCDQDTNSVSIPDEGVAPGDEGQTLSDTSSPELCADVGCDTSTDDLCHYTTCDLATGTCVPVFQNDGLACDDGNPCTESECNAGSCLVVSDCDDADPCTDDICHEVLGCQHEPIDECP